MEGSIDPPFRFSAFRDVGSSPSTNWAALDLKICIRVPRGHRLNTREMESHHRASNPIRRAGLPGARRCIGTSIERSASVSGRRPISAIALGHHVRKVLASCRRVRTFTVHDSCACFSRKTPQKVGNPTAVAAQIWRELWSGRPDSNRRRPAWEAGILPLNYARSRGDGASVFAGYETVNDPEMTPGPREAAPALDSTFTNANSNTET